MSQKQHTVSDSTPVIVGVGQYTERVTDAGYAGLAPYEIAARAARRACEDARAARNILESIDAIAATRTFEDSGAAPALFGKSNNFPRSIAKRLGIEPRTAIWTKAGGDSPQTLLVDLCHRLATGQIHVALLAGAEAISTVRHLSSLGQTRDFSDTCEGDVEDRGSGVEEMLRPYHLAYRFASAPVAYALCENARRARLGLSREAYAASMGELFAPFTSVAEANPYSSAPIATMSAAQLIADDERNRVIAEPYRIRLVARDQVNQGAAALLTTVGAARELGISPESCVFLHGHASLVERDLLERQDLGASPAAQLAARAALQGAGIGVGDIGYFDFYSCFPIAVSNVACDGLGLSANDARLLTVTGGLSFFGGPGNNYSLHAIASIVEKLRAARGSFGFIGANGGFLSKYAAGVYSTRPANWRAGDTRRLQEQIDAAAAPPLAEQADGAATIETYTVACKSGQPAYAVVVGRLASNGSRFLALCDGADEAAGMMTDEPLRRTIHVRSTPAGNRFTF